MPAFFTIGHSTRSIDDFVALLRSAGVELVADVRAIPRSRTNPQFNLEALPASLAAAGIGYEHLPALGGRRGRSAAGSSNDFWQNASFRNYADYAATAAFRAGLARLRELGSRQACAVMCAEAVWWRCHRRIIADYLLAEGETVFHILGPAHIEPARSTPSARRMPDGTLIYPKQPAADAR
jgi:uncharacterized protein (DUF488 family)